MQAARLDFTELSDENVNEIAETTHNILQREK